MRPPAGSERPPTRTLSASSTNTEPAVALLRIPTQRADDLVGALRKRPLRQPAVERPGLDLEPFHGSRCGSQGERGTAESDIAGASEAGPGREPERQSGETGEPHHLGGRGPPIRQQASRAKARGQAQQRSTHPGTLADQPAAPPSIQTLPRLSQRKRTTVSTWKVFGN